jgi:outer membrane protein assembly factor BamB
VLTTIADPTFTNYVYEIGGAPVLGAPGSVFVANYANAWLGGTAAANTLLNFRTDSGTIAWQSAGSYPTTPAYQAGTVYAVNNRPLDLEARSESDGTLLWSWTPANPLESKFVSEVLLTRNMAFVSTDQATYAIDLTTHLPAFSYPASGKLALSANAILYIQNATDLIAINLN